MNIKTTEVFKDTVGLLPAEWNWIAIDDNTYDGPSSPVGRGATEAEAITDLMEQFEA